jgi:hypothetical protein
MKFAYQRAGGPILDWRKAPPKQSRAAETAGMGLGSLGGGTTLDHPTLILPKPGAPEPIGVTQGMGGCGCSGSCGCGEGMGGILDAVPGGIVTVGIGAFILWKVLGKKRR